MSLEAYKLVHLICVFALFFAFGAAFMNPDRSRKWPTILHGVSLFLVLVAGFGMLARLGLMSGLPGWVWAKLGIWFLLGGSIALARRRVLPAWGLVCVLLVLGGGAAWLGIYKPF